MFKCFGSGSRPKKEEPQSWDELFARPSTDSYLTNVNTTGEGSSNQREQSQIRAPNDQSHTNNKSRSTDHSGNRGPSPLGIPSNTATRDDDEFSSTCGSHFGSAPDRIVDAADELAQLKLEARKAAAATPDASLGGGFTRSVNNHQTNDSNGFGFEKMDMAALKAAASTTVPQAKGAFAGFGAFGSQPKASVSAASLDSGATFSSSTVSASGSKSGGFTGFGAGSQSSTTVPAPAAPRTTTTLADTGFGFGERMTTVPRGGGGAFGSDSSTTAPVPRATPFTGFGAAAAAKKEEAQPKPFSGFGAAAAAKKEEAQPKAFSGFGSVSESSTTVSAPAAPRATPGFSGFGANSAARPHSAAVSPASATSRMFQAAMKDSVRATNTTVADPKTTVTTPPGNGFAGFKSPAAKTTTVATPPLNDCAGFGTVKKEEQVSPVSTNPGSGFSGFGSVKKEPESPVVPAAPFSGFGSLKSTRTSSAGDLSPIPTPDSSGRVQMNFGTLHVSGPVEKLISLKEKERSERREKEEEKSVQGRKRVHFEDLKEAKDALAMGEEPKLADTTADDTETDDDIEPQLQLYPWGNRPNFRTMLDGGKKKLVLIPPPAEVSNFFVNKVQRSYGCTYDNASNTFFATSPGQKGQPNGTVVALAGNCKGQPMVVSRNLVEPAAIAVYQQGLSVCVVTNRGIFIFERKYNEMRETIAFLSRQISRQGYHRGIAATAGGGIASFSNGKLRLFDGRVDNGQESVLAVANYDLIINNALFQDHPPRRMEKSNACFMDIVNNRLAVSDLQKHVISLWDIEETPAGCAIHFVRAIDVAVGAVSAGPQRGRVHINAKQIPLGKCAYASGIRLDAEGWVLCADADGRTIQIFDATLNFISRVETPPLPYISGLYIEAGGHMIVCDRKSEVGGLRVYMLDAVDKDAPSPAAVGGGVGGAAKMAAGFAAAAKKGSGGRF